MADQAKAVNLGGGILDDLPSSFSGQDFKAYAYYDANVIPRSSRVTPLANELAGTAAGEILSTSTDTNSEDVPAILRDGQILLGSLHTLTSSFAASMSPVTRIGSSYPIAHTRGQKTFAGSMVFTVLNFDPLRELIINLPAGDARGGPFTVDQLPPFNIVIWGSKELASINLGKVRLQNTIMKVIVGVQFVTHGESITIDDLYLEQSYQYRSQYTTPWLAGTTTLQDIDLKEKSRVIHTKGGKVELTSGGVFFSETEMLSQLGITQLDLDDGPGIELVNVGQFEYSIPDEVITSP